MIVNNLREQTQLSDVAARSTSSDLVGILRYLYLELRWRAFQRPSLRKGCVGWLQRAAVASVVLTLWANVALVHAGETTPAGSEIAQEAVKALPAVTVTGHYDNAVGTSDTASEGVVRGDLLQDIPLLRPGDVLETVPGLVVTQHSGDGKANQYFLRGYNLDHGTDFATRVDGVPVNMPTHAHGQGYSDLNFMIPELVDNINYRKGTYFAENGDFSSAGSADINYRKSLDHTIAQLSAGSFGFERLLLAGSTPLSGSTFLGAVELQRENGPWTIPENLQKVNALARLSDGTVANGWSIDGAHYSATWNSTDQIPLALINSGQLGRFGALDPTDGGNTGRDLLSGEWHSSDSAGYAKASAYIEHYRLQLWSDFTFYELRHLSAPNPSLPSDQFEQVEHRNILGGQIVKGWNHHFLEHDSTTELGAQLRHDNINVGLQDTQSRVTFATVTDDTVSENSIGLYLQNSTTWSPWLRTLGGLRRDQVTMNMTSHVLPQNSGSASAAKLSPKLSIILGPWAMTELFASAGKGFHSNDARGVIDKVDPTQPSASAISVPALTSSFGKEIGVRTEAIKGLQSSFALWILNSDSEITYNPDSNVGSTTPNGASNRYGIEWNNHWLAKRWLLVDADIAWTHARYANMNANGTTGNLIPNAVPKVARLVATIRDRGLWSGSIEARYIGPYPMSQDGVLTAPSAFVTNLRVAREISPSTTVLLDVLNMFSRKYYDIAYEQDYRLLLSGPIVPSGVTVHPGEPFQLRMTFRFKF